MKVQRIAAIFLCLLIAAGCSRSSRDELIQEGVRKTQEKNYRGAVVIFKSILERDEDDVHARFLLAEAYSNAGKIDLSEKEFSRVAARQPDYPGLATRRAELFVKSGRPAEARREIEQFLRTHPADPSSLALLGRAQLLDRQPEAAETTLREAVRLAPGETGPRRLLANSLAAQGKEAAARDILQGMIEENAADPEPYLHLARLENARGESDRALALYRRAGELDPNDLQSRYMTGLLLLEKGAAGEVETVADDILRRSPESPRGVQLKGFLFYLRGRYDESAASLQRTAEQYPEPLTFYVLGLDYLRLGKNELAVTQFQRILDYRPQAVQPRVVLALILLRQGRSDEAIHELERALQFDNGHALAHHLLGSALLAKGRFDQAMAEFDRAIALDPDLADAYLQKGLFTLSRGDLQGGEEHLIQALAVAPEIPDVRLVLARHYLRQRKFAEAARTLREGLTGHDSDALLFNFLAAASFGQKKNAEAVEFLEKAKAAKPDYFTPYYNLAAYFAGTGQAQKARQEYQAILKRDPSEARAWLLLAQVAERSGPAEEARASYLKAKETGKIEGYLGLAAYHLRRQDGRGALTVLDEALRNAPDNAEALEAKGRLLLGAKAYPDALRTAEALAKAAPERGLPLSAQILMEQGEVERALRTAERMAALLPNRPASYLLLAGVMERRGETATALKTVEEAPADCRKNLRLRLKRAELLALRGEYGAAVAVYEEIVRVDPELSPVWFALGSAHDRQGNREQAVRCYRQVLSRQADFLPALNNLAYLYADRDEHREEAARLAERAFRASPDNPWVLDTIGYVYYRQGRIREANAALEKAAGMLPNVPAVHYHLGLVQHRLGSREQAVRSLRSALGLGPFSEADKARALMNELTGTRASGKNP